MAETAPTHPVVREIVGELQLTQGEVVLPADRFDHWAKTLRAADDPLLYSHLVAAALILAKRKAPAAAQLFALSALRGGAR